MPHSKFFIALLVAGMPLIANEPQQRQLQQADEYFQATLFDQAIPLYEDLLDNVSNDERQAHIRMRLSQAYYAQKRYDAVIALTKGHDQPRELLYLSGLAQQHKGDVEAAQRDFETYLKSNPATPLFLLDEVHFELAQAYAQKKAWPQAEEHFKTITKSGVLFDQAQLSLAKIAIAQHAFAKARQLLDALTKRLSKDDALNNEVAYLQGQSYYLSNEFDRAVQYFERALLTRNANEAAWIPDTLYLLGWSYLKLGQFDKAEAVFLRHHQTKPSEQIALALGQLYLIQWQQLKDPKAPQALEDLLKHTVFHSYANEAQSLVLRASIAQTYAQRKQLYQQLTQQKYHETPFYGQGWYSKALNDYEGGIAFRQEQKIEEAKQAFASAATSFQKAYELLHKHDPALASFALKYQAESHGQQNNKEGYLNALTALSLLTQQQPALLATFKDPGEIFYLHALYASYVAQWEPRDPHADLAEQLLVEGLRLYPQSDMGDKMRFLLGTIYYHKKAYNQAEKTFLLLTTQHPKSALQGDAWFWAARSSDSLQKGNDTAKTYRRKVFESYPKSTYAAEAYFTYYPYRDYLQGDRNAIKHLQGMKALYPHSPFLINAFYLIGMDNKRDRKSPEGKWLRKKNMNDAIEALQEAESTFDTLYADGKLPMDDLKYLLKIRYRATLERALANLAIADESQGAKRQIFLEYAQEVFGKIVQEFKDAQHPFASQLAAQQAYPHLLEESSYWLAQAYSRSKEYDKAERILSEMLENYRRAKITRGYYLSRVWYDLGIIAMERQDNKLALQYFAHAEDAAKGHVLSTDQRIDLWIQQSMCHKALNDIEKAMLILSKAINDDAISSLRVKAMYLRAELYAQQGRHELARKQLEATSKKGGEWALKAKNRINNF